MNKGKDIIYRIKNVLSQKKYHAKMYVFPIAMVYFELLLRICTGTSVFAHLIYPIFFGSSVGFLLAVITSVFDEKWNKKISTVMLFVIGLFFVVECFIKRSFQWYMPITGIFSGAGNVAGNYISEVIRAVIYGIPIIVLFLAPGVLYAVFCKKYELAQKAEFSQVLKCLGCSIVCMMFAIGCVKESGAIAKYKSQFKFDTATEYFGLLTSSRLELKYSVLKNTTDNGFAMDTIKETTSEITNEIEAVVEEKIESKKIEPVKKNEMELNLEEISTSTSNAEVQELNTYVSSLTASNQNEYTGLFEGKNLILICAEAFSDAVIDEKLTPTLYRMTHNGFYFSEYYQPTWGGSTSTGEYSFLMGLVPLNGIQSMLDTQGKNLYFTLGNQLQRKGYYSAAYHNGSYDFYSRQLTHTNLGYSIWTAQGNGLETISGEFPGDEKFFDTTMDTYINSEQLFSIYYMTVSGHSVYNSESVYTQENLEHVKSIVGDKYKDTTVYYLCYQMELEHALTTMINKLEEANIVDDTVICLTSDHYPYGLDATETFGNSEDYLRDLYGYIPTTSWEHDRNSCIIWSGCLENENKDMVCEISAPTYSLDIVPTLSNLFGLEYDSRLLVGRDVFSEEEPLILWNTYSWVTDKGKYDSFNEIFYPNDGVKIEEGYVDRINALVTNKIVFSRKVIDNNYYGILFGEDIVN